MPTADESRVIFEISEYSLHALRVRKGVVEAGGECLLENRPGVEALLDAVAPARKTEGLPVTVGVWPGQADWHVSTSTEAMLDRTADALRAIAAADQKDPLLFAVCNATDGGAVLPDGLDTWIMAHSPQEAQMKVGAVLKSLNADAEGASPAAFASVGSVAAALKSESKEGAVIVWDLGVKRSTLILVTAAGAEASAPCAIGVESIFEAVQQALKLKFRGAGERLFFNESYDFTEAGPKIGAAIAARLKEAIAALPVPSSAPALTCLGLTAKQSWFVRESAAASGLVPWEPDLPALASAAGLTFADAQVKSQFSAASVGLMGLASSWVRGTTDWIPEWMEAEPVAEVEAQEPEAEPEPEPEPEPPPKPVAPIGRPKPSLSTEPASGPQVTFSTKPSNKPPVPPRSVTVPPVPSQAPQPGSTRPPMPTTPQVRLAPPAPGTPQVRLSPPAPAAPQAPSFSAPPPAPSFPAPSAPAFTSPGAPSFPAPGARPPSFSNPGFPMPSGSAHEPPAPARAGSFSNPGFPMPEPAGAAPTPPPAAPAMKIPEPAKAPPQTGPVTALPFEAVKMLKPVPPSAAPVAQPPKSRVGFYIGIGVVAALVFAAIAVVVEARLEKIKAYDLEQQEALAHHMAEMQLKQAEAEKAAQEEQSRKDMEAAVLQAKKEQEEETSKRVRAELEAERLSKMPGTLTVATSPAGASLSVDGGAPVKTPAKIEGLSPGSHRVQVTLAGHESVDTSIEILGSKTTDLGTLPLASIYGSVDLTSTPDGLEFAIRTSDDPSGKPVRTGRTPASFDDIPHGSYVVTFSRPGCKDHTVAVDVQKATKSPVDTKYVDGALELTSDPSGANVSKDGAFLGTTPLSLNNLTPKLATFDLTLPGYDPTPISIQIPEGDTLKYSAQLLRKDRVFTASEVKTAPVAVESPAPVLSAAQRKLGADVVLSIVVRKDGSVTGVEVVSATDDDIARRCKTAVEKWRFRPATAPDDRTVQARIEVPFKFPAGAP